VAGTLTALALAVGAALWFGWLDWMFDDRHPARPAVEAGSWVVAIVGFLVTLGLAFRDRRGAAAAAMPPHTLAAVGESAGDGSVTGGVHGHGSGQTFGVVNGPVNNGSQPPDPPAPART
jgi:xanthine/uracil/vitamin C permease (AzgA family)